MVHSRWDSDARSVQRGILNRASLAGPLVELQWARSELEIDARQAPVRPDEKANAPVRESKAPVALVRNRRPATAIVGRVAGAARADNYEREGWGSGDMGDSIHGPRESRARHEPPAFAEILLDRHVVVVVLGRRNVTAGRDAASVREERDRGQPRRLVAMRHGGFR